MACSPYLARRRALVAVWIGMAAAACSSGDSGGSSSAQVEGVWWLSSQFQVASPLTTCGDTMRLRATSSGAAFSLTGVQYGGCLLGGGVAINMDGQVSTTAGQVGSENAVTFQLAGCDYSGAITGGGGAMSGSVQCTVDLPGGPVQASGLWTAYRNDSIGPLIVG